MSPPLKIGVRPVDEVARARLEVVREPRAREVVVAEHDVVRADARGGKEVRALDDVVLVRADLGRAGADRAEDRRVVVPAARLVMEDRALNEVGEPGAGVLERELPAGVLRLHEEVARDDAVVVPGPLLLGKLAVVDAGLVVVLQGGEGVVGVGVVDADHVAGERVVRERRERQLAFVALLVVPEVVVEHRRAVRAGRGLGGDAGGGAAIGAEEPDVVFPERAAEGGLVRGQNVLRRRFLRRADRGPRGVREAGPEGAGEDVAAGLRDGVDDAAREAPEFRGDGGRRRRRLLDRVLDEEVDRRAADVVVHDDAVHGEEVVERLRARDRDGAVRAVLVDTSSPPH